MRFAEKKRIAGDGARIITSATIAGRIKGCAFTVMTFCATLATVRELKSELRHSTAITIARTKPFALTAAMWKAIAGRWAKVCGIAEIANASTN